MMMPIVARRPPVAVIGAAESLSSISTTGGFWLSDPRSSQRPNLRLPNPPDLLAGHPVARLTRSKHAWIVVFHLQAVQWDGSDWLSREASRSGNLDSPVPPVPDWTDVAGQMSRMMPVRVDELSLLLVAARTEIPCSVSRPRTVLKCAQHRRVCLDCLAWLM